MWVTLRGGVISYSETPVCYSFSFFSLFPFFSFFLSFFHSLLIADIGKRWESNKEEYYYTNVSLKSMIQNTKRHALWLPLSASLLHSLFLIGLPLALFSRQKVIILSSLLFFLSSLLFFLSSLLIIVILDEMEMHEWLNEVVKQKVMIEDIIDNFEMDE